MMHGASVTLSPLLLFTATAALPLATRRGGAPAAAQGSRHYGTGTTQALWLGALQCGAALYGCAAKRGGVPAAAQDARHSDASTAQAHRLKARAATRRKAAAAARGRRRMRGGPKAPRPVTIRRVQQSRTPAVRRRRAAPAPRPIRRPRGRRRVAAAVDAARGHRGGATKGDGTQA